MQYLDFEKHWVNKSLSEHLPGIKDLELAEESCLECEGRHIQRRNQVWVCNGEGG